jgi:protein TonB
MTPSQALLLSLALHGAGACAAALTKVGFGAHVDWNGAEAPAIEISLARARAPEVAVIAAPPPPAFDQVPEFVDDGQLPEDEPPPPVLSRPDGAFRPAAAPDAPPPRHYSHLAQRVQPERTDAVITAEAPPVLAAEARLPREGASVQPSAIPGHNAPPRYPFVAWRRHIEGTVVVELDVDASGDVTATRLAKSSGCRMLDDAAVQQLRSWKFTAAQGPLGPMRCTFTQEVIFRIRA